MKISYQPTGRPKRRVLLFALFMFASAATFVAARGAFTTSLRFLSGSTTVAVPATATLAPAVVTTIVNYDFNSGASYGALTPALASGVLSQASSTQPFATSAGTATTGPAFTANATAGQAIHMADSSGANIKYFQFVLAGSSLPIYNNYRVYAQAQRSGTGAQTVTLAYSTDGINFTNFGTTLAPPDGSFAAQVFDLSAITALNHRSLIYFRLLASGATGTGTLRVDNFQVQANSTAPGAPSVAGNKTVSLANDVNGNTFVNPGDTLMYSVTFTNTGTAATGVSFSDMLSNDLTLVGGSVTASPIAVNDTYSAIGNVNLNVTTGVLANDVDPLGVALTVTGIAACADVTAPFVCTTANGGDITVQSNGQFTYNPAPGFEGSDFFVYTTSNGTKADMAIATINVSGMIWFINAAAGAGGDGRLLTPFNTLVGFTAISTDDPGDNIFLYSGSYSGAITLLGNQKLIGQGATASLASITGLTAPMFSNSLPVTGLTRPTITHSATLLTLGQGNLIRGFNVTNTAGAGITGTSFGNLTASEISVTASNAGGACTAAVNLNTGNPTATFTSISASACTNGIVLSSTTGSFTVTGTGAADSGGIIQNTTGSGIVATNAQNLSLTRMRIANPGNHGIEATNLGGTCLLANSTIIDFALATGNGFKILNTSTNLTLLTISATTFNGTATGNAGVSMEAVGTSNMTLSIEASCVFTDMFGDGVQALTQTGFTGTISATVKNSTFNTAAAVGNGGIFMAPFGGPGTFNFDIDSNSFSDIMRPLTNLGAINVTDGDLDGSGPTVNGQIRNNTLTNIVGSRGIAVIADTFAGPFDLTVDNNNIDRLGSTSKHAINVGIRNNVTNADVKIRNNDIGQNPSPAAAGTLWTAGNGTAEAILVLTQDAASANVQINNNVVSANALLEVVRVRAIGTSTQNATITSNTLTDTNGAHIELAAVTATGTPTMCANISGNVLPAAGVGVIQLTESAGTLNVTQASAASVAAANSGATVTVSGAPTFGSAACMLPTFAPIETEQLQLRNQSGNQAQLAAPRGSATPGFFARMRQWSNSLWPVFSAFAAPHGYVKLDGAFAASSTGSDSDLVPAAASNSADPLATARGTDSAVVNQPAKTMVINSRAAARVVPTAALSGETVMVPLSGNFTLPAGKSITVMFNATIGAGVTATSVSNTASLSGGNFTTVNSNTLVTPIIQAPGIIKGFSPTSIALSGTNLTTSTLTLTLTNPNSAQQLTNVAFTDSFPSGLAVADVPMAMASAGCGAATFAPAANATSLSFSGGTINVGTPCIVTVKVKGTSSGAKPNFANGATSTQANAGANSNTVTLNVLNAPTFTKAFGAALVALNGTTSLTFNITNADATFGLTGVGFTDTLPTGLTVAATPNVTGTCGGGTITAAANSGTISLSGASLAASGSCSFSVDVTGTTAGAKNNSVSLVTNETGTNSTPATSTLNVFAPPTFSKNFVASPIVVGQTTTLNILVSNPAANPANLTGIALTDTLPAGITTPDLAATPQCGGTLTISGNVITLTGGSIAPNTTCTITRTVTGVQAQVAAWTNTISSVSSTNGGTNSTPATANITVNKANTVASITDDTPDPSVVGQPYTVTAGVSVAAPGAATPTAPTGTITVSDGSQTCTITLPATTCMLTSTTAGAKTLTATYNGDTNFNVSAASAGAAHTVNKANTTTTITADTPDPSNPGASVAVSFTVVANSPGSGTPTGNVTVSDGVDSCIGTVAAGTCNITLNTPGLRTLTATYSMDSNFNGSVSAGVPHQVATPPTVAKSFLPTQIKVNETSVMTFSVTNPNAGLALSNISFNDTFPAGVEVDNPVVMTNTCGGSFSPALVGGATSFSYIGGSIGAGGPACAISVQVKATTAGVKDNTTGVISATQTGPGATSNTATLTVVGAPVLVKAFTPATVVVGQPSSMGFTITNNNTTVALTGIAFSDTLPAGMTVANSGPTATCGGTLTATAPNAVSFSGGTLAAGSPVPTTCMFSVTVATTAVGALVNTTGAITSVESGPGATATATLTVNKANTITTITNAAALAGTPTVVGQPYTVSVSVAPVAPGSGVPTGMVNVSDGTGGTCVVTLSGGVGSCSLTSTTVGAKTITATYVMDSNFNGSATSAAHTVNQAATTTTITNAVALATATVVGQSYAVNWSVTVNAPGAVGAALTGNVTVDAGGGNTCVAAVSAGTCNIVSTTAGVKSITATYAGDANYNGSASSPATPHTVNKADTTTVITNAATLGLTPTIVGEAYAVNWSVTVNAPGAIGAALTGNVTVTDGTGGMCVAAVSAGTCNITSTSTGAKTITATYAGDANYNGSAGTASHTVNKPSTTTTITADAPDPSVTGQAYQVDVAVAVVAPGVGTPTGAINVSDGTGGTCVITLPATSCNLTSLTAGAKTLTAMYVGDMNFNGGTSAGVTHTVNKANTTTAILSDAPDPSVVGQNVTVTYSVAVTAPGSGTPTGNVLVSDGVNSCTGTVAAGQCVVALFTPGARTLTATYQGDANYNASAASPGAAHQVNKADTTTTITADTPDPSVIGQQYAVTANVTVNSPGAGTPTGSITVSDGTNNCTITLPATSCNLPSTSVGAKTLTATYNGDASYNVSPASAGVPHQVNKADTTTTITADVPDPSVVGQPYAVTANVAVNAPGVGTPTGTITVSDGAQSCTITLPATSCNLTSTTAGAKTLTATYNGDASFNTSPASAGVPHQVNKADTTTTITADVPDPSVVGQPYAVTANVAVNAPGVGVLTGTITVSDGAQSCTIMLPATSCNLVSTTAGAKTLTATYNGDANFNLSPASAGVAHTVNKADTTTTITADVPDPSSVNQNVVVNYSVVVNAPGAGTPTGNVTVSDGVNSCTGTVAAGTCTVALATSGLRTLTATYAGDAQFNGGVSAGVSHTVASPPTLSMSFSQSNLLLNNVATLTFTLTNPNAGVTLSGVGFSATLPAGLVVAPASSLLPTSEPNAETQRKFAPDAACSGTLTALANSTSISFSGGVIAPNTTCTVEVRVLATAVGVKTLTVNNLVSENAGPGIVAGVTTQLIVDMASVVAAIPPTCVGAGTLLNLTAQLTNNGIVNQTATFNAALPSQLRGVPASCNANTGACTVSQTAVNWSGTLTPNQTVTINYQVEVGDGAAGQLCLVTSATFNGTPAGSITTCVTANCASFGPGQVYPANSPVSDQRAGSVLIYNLMTSDASNPARQNTRVSLTNADPARTATVHLFLVDGSSCSVADSYLCLTPNQTASFLANDLDPGTTGYLVAVATDRNGCPTNFNALIGDEYVKLSSGHAANLGAEAIPALPGGVIACDLNASSLTLNFDGVMYGMLPRMLALSNFGSRLDGNNTLLVVNRIGGNLATGAATLGTLFGQMYDDAEKLYSFSLPASGCQLRGSLSDSFPRTVPRLDQVVSSGRSGWLKLAMGTDGAILGAAINANRNAASSGGAFNQGHNLHKLTLTGVASYTIPIFPPGC